ncbi:MAG: hypothetical protein LC135_13750 [Phycisphaerae bacterium]|nr:hypothetical protein [Phycisphaerae bacterium]MCZ2400914.1 hypothetical protein [Phycisphaerae bacterium]
MFWHHARNGLAALAVLGVLALTGLLLAAARRPAWYQPRSVDHARLAIDKAAAFRTVDEISAALNARQPIEFALDEAQVNRWLAARCEIWPDAELARLTPLERPLVHMLPDGTLRVAATVAAGEWRGVLALTFRFETAGDELVIHWTGVQFGALPVPRHWVSGAIDRFVPSQAAPLRAFDQGASRIPNRWTWPNGRRDFRIERLEVRAGEVLIRLAPL